MCNTGIGLIPLIDGKLHHFSAGGLFDGLVLLCDDETGTYWNHITGEAVHGPLAGAALELFYLEEATAAAALAQHPDIRLIRQKLPLKWRMMRMGASTGLMDGRLPPGFRGTMGERDARMPLMALGLGLMADAQQVFYPLDAIRAAVAADGLRDTFDGRPLRLWIDDGVPRAEYTDAAGDRPLQLFTRWYGFAYTYPECTVRRPEADA